MMACDVSPVAMFLIGRLPLSAASQTVMKTTNRLSVQLCSLFLFICDLFVVQYELLNVRGFVAKVHPDPDFP